jgi:hypothetical protein
VTTSRRTDLGGRARAQTGWLKIGRPCPLGAGLCSGGFASMGRPPRQTARGHDPQGPLVRPVRGGLLRSGQAEIGVLARRTPARLPRRPPRVRNPRRPRRADAIVNAARARGPKMGLQRRRASIGTRKRGFNDAGPRSEAENGGFNDAGPRSDAESGGCRWAEPRLAAWTRDSRGGVGTLESGSRARNEILPRAATRARGSKHSGASLEAREPGFHQGPASIGRREPGV